ncbi:hypothetical protein DBP12_36925 [Streptomyces sp. CS014]|nr:hypothetical protein DBP12_36925 [Streptomyces sp. CS014]
MGHRGGAGTGIAAAALRRPEITAATVRRSGSGSGRAITSHSTGTGHPAARSPDAMRPWSRSAAPVSSSSGYAAPTESSSSTPGEESTRTGPRAGAPPALAAVFASGTAIGALARARFDRCVTERSNAVP